MAGNLEPRPHASPGERRTHDYVTGREVVAPVNPKDAVATHRISLSLYPPAARAWGALALTEGDLKYGGYNFREAPILASVYYDSINRHLDKWLNGEDVDPDTGVPHLASVNGGSAILIDAIVQGNIIDDRPPKQSSTFFKDLESKVGFLYKIFPRRAQRKRAKGGS